MSKTVKRIVATMFAFFLVLGIVVSSTEEKEILFEIDTTTAPTTEESAGYSIRPLVLTKEDYAEVSITEVTSKETITKKQEATKKVEPTTTKKVEQTTTQKVKQTTTKKVVPTTTKLSVQPTTKVQATTKVQSTTKVAVTQTAKPVETTKTTNPTSTVKPLKEGTVVNPKLKSSEIVLEEYKWSGKKLNSYDGTVAGPNGKETYYNLNMSGVVKIMRNLGYNYEYWVRNDGVKMYGPFIMVAANLNLRPRGSIIKTSLGWGLVCDTGDFAKTNPTQLDIAVSW